MIDVSGVKKSWKRYFLASSVVALVFIVFLRSPNRAELDTAEWWRDPRSISEAVPLSQERAPETGDGPRGKRIVLLTAANEDGVRNSFIPNMTRRVVENRQEYADWHGYDFQFIDMSKMFFPGHAVWKKIAAIKQSFMDHPQAEWVWWLDVDAILMTSHVPLSTHLLHPSAMAKKLESRDNMKDVKAEDVNLLYGADGNGLNAGSLFFRRSNWTDTLFDTWTTPEVMLKFSDGYREQDALSHLINTREEIGNRTGMIDLRELNSYTRGTDNIAWQANDLAVHFAGCYNPRACHLSWERFWSLRSPVPKQFLQSPRKYP